MKTKLVVVSIHLFVLALAIAVYLHIRGNRQSGGIQVDSINIRNIFFYNNGDTPNVTAYIEFLAELRRRLASGATSHDIPVLRSPGTIPVAERFIQVQLRNGDGGDTITAVIDVGNVYVLGFLVGITAPVFYYLDGTPDAARQAFPRSERLGFGGSYMDLPDRDAHILGHGPLNTAITTLSHANTASSNSKKLAVLVIIQMVAEAARIRYIEHLVRSSMISRTEECLVFTPDYKMITMENRWSDLSQQAQRAGSSREVFGRSVEIGTVNGDQVSITSVILLGRLASLALMLYDCNQPRSNSNNDSSLLPAGVNQEYCPIVEPTTNIIGTNRFCVQVKDGDYTDWNMVILWPCGRDQLWTFKSDYTIRSKNKCLVAGNYERAPIAISDCDKEPPLTSQWILNNAGTIMHSWSGYVMGADGLTQGSPLSLGPDRNTTWQAWTASVYPQETINYITGLNEMCLQANGVNNRVWLEDCVINEEPRQRWVLYDDATIRPYGNINLCVTADGPKRMHSIILSSCAGLTVQRWTFMADGTILNPNPTARLVMDVFNGDVDAHRIILFEPTGRSNQNWLAF